MSHGQNLRSTSGEPLSLLRSNFFKFQPQLGPGKQVLLMFSWTIFKIKYIIGLHCIVFAYRWDNFYGSILLFTGKDELWEKAYLHVANQTVEKEWKGVKLIMTTFATILPVFIRCFLVSRGQILRPLRGGYSRLWHRGCHTGPRGFIGWRAGTTALCQSRLYPPVRDYDFGYSLPVYSFVVSFLKGWRE
jgi:hypothetical protein